MTATIKTDNTQALYNALAVIEQQRAVMQKAREALEEGKHYTFLAEQYQDESNFRELAEEALSLLNGCLKVGE